MAVTVEIVVSDIRTTAAVYDRIKVFRAPEIDGTYVEITASGTRIPIEVGRSIYLYLDPAGEPTDYYKVSFLNVASGAESDLSNAISGASDPSFDVISVAELKDVFLFGLDIKDSKGNEPSDTFYEFYIRAAVGYLERMLDIPLRTLTVINEKADFYVDDYNRHIFLRTLNFPIISVEEIRLVLPTEQKVITYMDEWVYDDKPSGQIMIIPGTGGAQAIILGLSTSFLPIVYGTHSFIPDVFRIDYTAGFEKIPPELKDLVGMLASIGPLSIFGDIIFGPGVAGNSVTLDSLMTNVRTTKDRGQGAFASRIDAYRREVSQRIKDLRRQYKGARFVVV